MSNVQKGAFARKPSPLARCKLAAGKNPYAGELLYQLCYRFGRKEALQERYGKMWCAQTAGNWQAELALSKEQYKTALRLLKDYGLVEHMVEPFSAYHIYGITWLRLSPKGEAILNDVYGAKHTALLTPGTGGDHASQQASMTPSQGVNGPYTGNTKQEGKKGKESQYPAGGDIEGKWTFATKQEIEKYWLDAHAKFRPDLSVSQFHGADWKWAAEIRLRLQGDARDTIMAVVERWEDFTVDVAMDAKFFLHPARPQLGYLAHFGSIARDFAKKPPKQSVSDPVQEKLELALKKKLEW
jgi:hypothetical protein